jgi:hypothetical protein
LIAKRSKLQLVLVAVPPESREGEPLALTPAQSLLRKPYARALDDLFAFCASRPLSRSLLMEWRAGMEPLSPSTINGMCGSKGLECVHLKFEADAFGFLQGCDYTE